MAWTQDEIKELYSEWKIQPGESLVEYYKRLAELRKGGILGTQGMMDVAKEAAAAKQEEKNKASSDIALGQESVNTGSSSSDGDTTPVKPATLEDMVRAKSGAGFDPLQLFGILGGPLGSAMAMGGGMLRDSAIGKDLEAMGYSEAEIEAMMADPGLMQMELSMNPSAGFGKDWDKSDLKDGTTMVERLFGDIFGKEERSAPESLMMASARRSPYSNVTGMQNGMFTANIPSLGGNVGFTPGIVANTPQDVQAYWTQMSADALAAQAAADAQTKAAYEQAVAQGGTTSSYSSDSSGGSTTNYASSGGTSTVGTGGGNASRGYSYGGW